MTVRVRFFHEEVHHSFEYRVQSWDLGDSLNSVHAQIVDYCDEVNINPLSVNRISTYIS